ncbi:MAG TPA: penicillin-binding protein, partial [Sphingomicrobium sp.]
VANRPVEQFQTQVPMPDWQLTPDEEMFGNQSMDANQMAPMVDENGMPINQPPMEPGQPQQQPMVRPDGTGEPSQQELDQAFPPEQRPPPNVPPRQPPPRQPPPRSPPPDATEPRPYTA